MMTCREMTEFLDRHVEGSLTPAEKATFDEHLAVCPDCTNYVESYETTIDACRSAEGVGSGSVPGDVPEALVKAILAARDAEAAGDGESKD